ncbi:hypothetical protein DOTSEDRAFT_47243 [Dothistroma septosporum NZE10]|uniref:Uncharacterized protein n=1 Tax=Dothistroma septosporum (strain NZE10 / CBS 128990) TaxID=675120 RepID=N1PI68_DOTSN|nr:hypothetical protein DOTSEDRAFT_47243 [Dothistroma septosporum NZE10]
MSPKPFNEWEDEYASEPEDDRRQPWEYNLMKTNQWPGPWKEWQPSENAPWAKPWIEWMCTYSQGAHPTQGS